MIEEEQRGALGDVRYALEEASFKQFFESMRDYNCSRFKAFILRGV